ncbi:MAG: TlpA family protein disulfide reductase [Deltaproteobacteria bacterium]|nr:TlpA family protein disulfide reductase [Deltaproteobacteria bacterium]
MKRFILAGSLFFCILAVGGAGTAEEEIPGDFTLASLDGKTVSLHDYLHQKIIVINFWAAWCDACEEEMPLLLNLKNKYASRKNVVFLGINAGDSERSAQKFVEKTGYSYEILLDHNKSVARKFRVLGIPQTLVISREGKIVYRQGRPPEDLRIAEGAESAR